MKKLYLLLILCAALKCDAQFKPVVVSDAMFDPNFETASLSPLDGWYCRFGNDTAWAQNNISSAGWQKLGPMDLSAKYAGKNGKVECWFRITLKLDPSLQKTGYNILYSSFAPADIYINGKRIGSVGNTGLYGHPYSEYYTEFLGEPAIPIPFKNGDQFTLTLHVVDSLAPLLPGKIKSQLMGSVDIIYLASANSNQLVEADYFKSVKSYTVWLSGCALLSLLFWLLVIQNRGEKVFLYIAVWSTLTALFNYAGLRMYEGLHSLAYVIFRLITTFTLIFAFVLIPVVIAEIFKRTLLNWVKIVLAMLPLIVLFKQFFPWPPFNVLIFVTYLFLIGLTTYYIISSWKRLRGAQWSVVAGLLGFLLLMLVGVITTLIFRVRLFQDNGAGFYLFTAAILIFPFSLLVFVAMRFNEMLREVKQNADEVVRLSEEKKEEALNRQRLLQEEVDRQTAEIRAGQARLIQAEKMASLGELTAGIAHEIQNPLNFVNNFSEVSVELIGELKEELQKGDIEEAAAIATDVEQNLEKIRHHGKRADGIVKGMLEHSRASTGQKQPADLNKLADEYFRLAYHGLRAKDKSFNADLITHFDEKLPLVNIISQDIGRVLINLFNNAFYATNQRSKTAGAGYKPTVELSTRAKNEQIEVRIKDNGVGIAEAVKDKIMQPFFTTKPTGQGTGLGLSLSYDIVVKGHGGSINVGSTEGESSEFIISLPVF